MDKKSVGAGLAAGALLGALAGVLLAPKSGKETRADVIRFMRSTSKKVVSQAKRLKGLTQEKYDKIVDQVVAKSSEAVKLGQKELVEWKETLKGKFNEVKRQAAKK